MRLRKQKELEGRTRRKEEANERWANGGVGVGCLPSNACCTLRFKDCVLVALAEDGPPDDGGLEARLISHNPK